MSDRRVAWICAQLDATEAAAKACSGDGRWTAEDIAHIAPNLGVEPRVHMALHDPAAAVADVEAKRAILDEHQCAPAYDDSLYETTAPKVCSTCDHHEITGEWTLWPCKTVRLLAEGFRGRPGYEEAMRDGADS